MRAYRILPALIALIAASVVNASLFQIAPVTVDVQPGQSAAVVTVTNHSEAAISLQARVFRWTQSGGTETLTPTNDVIVSPPMVEVPAGAEHVIRVVRLPHAAPEKEEAYRLWVDQLPTGSAGPGDVRLLVRQSIPVFFGAAHNASAELHWTLSTTPGGWRLVAENIGAQRARISDLELRDPTGKVVHRQSGLVGYVLGRSTMSWPVHLNGAPTSQLNLTAYTFAGPISAKVAAPAAS